MKPGDKGPEGSRRPLGRSITRTRLSVVTQVQAGSLSYLVNPGIDAEATGTGTHRACRRNTGWHEGKEIE